MAEASIRLTAKDDTGGVLAQFRREMAATERATNITAAALSGLTGGLLAGAGAGAFLAFAKNVNNGVDALNDVKDATGASIENISALEDIAARTGTRFETVGTSLVKFNGVLKDLDPDGKAAAIFKRLGLDAEALRKLDPAEALRQTAVALSGFADDGDKARVVQELFGKSIREVAPFLKDLSEATKLQGTVTTEAAQAAEKFNQEIFALQKNALDASRVIIGPLIQSVNASVQAFKNSQGALSGLSAALATFFTGGDQFRNDKRLVELVDQQLDLEKKLSDAKGLGIFGQGKVKNIEGELARVNAELATTLIYRKQLETASEQAATLISPKAAARIGNVGGKTKAGKADDPAAIAKREAEELARLMDGLQAKEGGLDPSFFKNWEVLNREYEKGSINLTRLIELQGLLLAQQPIAAQAKQAEIEIARQRNAEFDVEFERIEREREVIEGRIRSARQMHESIEFETSLIGLSNVQREKAIALRQLEGQGVGKGTEAYEAYAAKIQGALDTQERTNKAQRDFETLSGSVTQLMRGNGDAVKSMVDNMINEFLRLKVVEPLLRGIFGGASAGGVGGSIGGGVGSFIGSLFGGFFANGGDPPVGKASIVGENGPEWFVPRAAGTIVPNGASAAAPTIVNIYNTVGDVASVSVVERGMQTVRGQIMGDLARRQRYSGGLA